MLGSDLASTRYTTQFEPSETGAETSPTLELKAAPSCFPLPTLGMDPDRENSSLVLGSKPSAFATASNLSPALARLLSSSALVLASSTDFSCLRAATTLSRT